MNVQNVLWLLIFLLSPPFVTPFYIGFAQRSITPEVFQVEHGQWYQCFSLRSTSEPLLGFSIYNLATQKYFPDGIQFYTDPAYQCRGDPSLVVTLSKRPGVYWVDLKEMGLARKYTCWRYYDLQYNVFKLQNKNPLSTRKGYVRGSNQDLAFKKDSKSGEWVQVNKLSDVPNASHIAALEGGGKAHYTGEYIQKYGHPPETAKRGEPNKAIPYIESRLKQWSSPSNEVEEDLDVPVPEQISIAQRGDTMAREEVEKKYMPGSLEYLKYIVQRPTKPAEMLPTTQRMFEILKQNAQGKINIPSPETAFGLDSLKADLKIPELTEEVGRLTLDKDSNDVELGWTLLRLALLRDLVPVKEGTDMIGGSAQKGTESTAFLRANRGRRNTVSGMPNLSQVDASDEPKIIPKMKVPPVPIARNAGPGGAAPSQRGSKSLRGFGSEEPEGGGFSQNRRQPMARAGWKVIPAYDPLEGFEPGITVNDIQEMEDRRFNILTEQFSPFIGSEVQEGNIMGGKIEEEKLEREMEEEERKSMEEEVRGTMEEELEGEVEDRVEDVIEVMGGTAEAEAETESEKQRAWDEALQKIDLEDIQGMDEFSFSEPIGFPERIKNLMTAGLEGLEEFETIENQEGPDPAGPRNSGNL
ncbi:hypothetical protein TWF281_007651 [Arthrobotrys megalospora]